MSHWSATKAKRVLAALLLIGWSIKRQSGSHKTLERAGWEDYVFAFHDGLYLFGLPLEEATFFLVTNLLVVQGLLLFYCLRTHSRQCRRLDCDSMGRLSL